MKFLANLALLFLTTFSFAQTDFSSVSLDTPEDVVVAESAALEASELVLSTPPSKMTKEINEANLFLLTWMEKTEHTFILNLNMLKICKKNDLFGVYLAALVKGRLGYQDDYAANAVKEFISYVKNENMGVQKSGKIKKLIKADETGDLSAYVN